jgi:hypothetical protein
MSTLPFRSSVAVIPCRGALSSPRSKRPSVDHIVLRLRFDPSHSSAHDEHLPSGSSVAVCPSRASFRSPVGVNVFVVESDFCTGDWHFGCAFFAKAACDKDSPIGQQCRSMAARCAFILRASDKEPESTIVDCSVADVWDGGGSRGG